MSKDDSSPDISEDEDLAIEDEVEKSQPKDSTSQTQQKPARFEQSGGLDFSFTAYDQDITILGAKSSGKSYLANSIMKSLNGVAFLSNFLKGSGPVDLIISSGS